MLHYDALRVGGRLRGGLPGRQRDAGRHARLHGVRHEGHARGTRLRHGARLVDGPRQQSGAVVLLLRLGLAYITLLVYLSVVQWLKISC